jgi:hypothetical protein
VLQLWITLFIQHQVSSIQYLANCGINDRFHDVVIFGSGLSGLWFKLTFYCRKRKAIQLLNTVILLDTLKPIPYSHLHSIRVAVITINKGVRKWKS